MVTVLEHSDTEMNKAWCLSSEEIDVYTATVIYHVRAIQVVWIGLLKTVKGVILLGWEEWEKVTLELRIQEDVSRVPKATPSFGDVLGNLTGLSI